VAPRFFGWGFCQKIMNSCKFQKLRATKIGLARIYANCAKNTEKKVRMEQHFGAILRQPIWAAHFYHE